MSRSALAAGGRGGGSDGAAHGFELFVAAGHPHPRGRATAGGRSGAQDRHPRRRPSAADQLHEWAAERAPALGMPVAALEAYAYAARVAEVENPDCHLAWTTLAGIGQVESHHGTYRGAMIAPNGDVRPPIRGVRLDGTNGNLEIIDNDGGRRRRPDLCPGDGPDAVHPRDLEALRRRRQQRRHHQPGQLRRRRAVGGGLPVLARQGPGHAAGLDERAARLQPFRPVRPHRARLGDGLRRTDTPSKHAARASNL